MRRDRNRDRDRDKEIEIIEIEIIAIDTAIFDSELGIGVQIDFHELGRFLVFVIPRILCCFMSVVVVGVAPGECVVVGVVV